MSTNDLSASELDRRVIVCSACQTAACWHGVFVCEDARRADVKLLTVRELRALALENPRFWGEG